MQRRRYKSPGHEVFNIICVKQETRFSQEEVAWKYLKCKKVVPRFVEFSNQSQKSGTFKIPFPNQEAKIII